MQYWPRNDRDNERYASDLHMLISANAEASARITGLEQNFVALSKNITEQFTSLNLKMDEGRRPQYTLLIGIATLGIAFTGAIGALAYTPIKEDIARLGQITSKIADTSASMHDLASLEDKVTQRFVNGKERLADWQRQAELRSEKNTKYIEDLRAIVVPRPEMEEKWRGNDWRFADLQRQSDEMKKSFADLSPAKDLIGSLQRRVDELSQAIWSKGEKK